MFLCMCEYCFMTDMEKWSGSTFFFPPQTMTTAFFWGAFISLLDRTAVERQESEWIKGRG